MTRKPTPAFQNNPTPIKLLERLKTKHSPDSHEPQIEGSEKPASNFSGNLGMILAEGTLMTHEKTSYQIGTWLNTENFIDI